LPTKKFSKNLEKKTMSRKLRIIALHGWKQNAAVLRAKTGALRKATAHQADWFFVDAPHLVESDANQSESEERTFWTFKEDDKLHYGGVQETVATIASAMRAFAPIDGIFGFSQGSGVATYLLGACANDAAFAAANPDLSALRFAILVSGFKPRATEMQRVLADASVTVPALIVIGKADQIIKPETTMLQSALFTDATVRTHDGGHSVANKASVEEMTLFLSRFVVTQ
jgi:predicted esterase